MSCRVGTCHLISLTSSLSMQDVPALCLGSDFLRWSNVLNLTPTSALAVARSVGRLLVMAVLRGSSFAHPSDVPHIIAATPPCSSTFLLFLAMRRCHLYLVLCSSLQSPWIIFERVPRFHGPVCSTFVVCSSFSTCSLHFNLPWCGRLPSLSSCYGAHRWSFAWDSKVVFRSLTLGAGLVSI